ncbi:Retrovirus-related Pol polyprotein from transposon gypsy [Nosema granulosis]|uniref:Retrovirus-related Pol polyprotein from transposon gypsy n=1 Tax=Nosema granulosis TaxID=83296 RepID=A0A9P6GXU2_9MICR|nr:Retrovirus-related Pol polyprotein from transposon gypsy [Nosema granulosis]
MDIILGKENRKFVIPYLYDVIVYSKNIADHKDHLRIVMGKLKAAGISLNEAKFKFFKNEVKILGNIISQGSIKVDPERTERISAYLEPQNIKELRSFLGVANYCREFVQGFADLTALI